MSPAQVPEPVYRGRFAPSPTGALHLGSLAAAAASYIDALAHKGEWLVRIEDIDPPRELPGASAKILECLTAHGFRFDTTDFQSSRLPAYEQDVQQLLHSGLAYPCRCTRKQLQASARPGRAGFIYPGTCRDRPPHEAAEINAVRLRVAAGTMCFQDRVQGLLCCDVATEIGDFLLKRGDGYIAYQAAVVHDDAAQHITHVVRGADLIDATFMQLVLYRALQLKPPTYLHIPVITTPDGTKLSKQSGAQAINIKTPSINILNMLSILKMNPPTSLHKAPPAELWAWAADNWQPQRLTGLRTITDRSMMPQ